MIANQELKSYRAKEFFNKTSIYLSGNFNIRIRSGVVKDFIKNFHFGNILDIACGDAAISVPLLDSTKKLVLLDISANMLREAEAKLTDEFKKNTEFICADFLTTDFQEETFDLILCLGFLAHSDDPFMAISRISGLLKPGGMLIIQNSDAGHFYFKMIKIAGFIKNIFRKDKYGYQFNEIKEKDLKLKFIESGLVLKRTFKYNQSFLFFSSIYSAAFKYKITSFLFGNASENRNKWLGSEGLYALIKSDAGRK